MAGLAHARFEVGEEEVGVVLLGDYSHLHAGDEVERTGRVMDVAVGERVHARLTDSGLPPQGLFTVPTSVQTIYLRTKLLHFLYLVVFFSL